MWDSAGTEADLAKLPMAAFFPAHGVAAFRSGWEQTSAETTRKGEGKGSYLALKGGDSMATHQDLDHGSFVWEVTPQASTARCHATH